MLFAKRGRCQSCCCFSRTLIPSLILLLVIGGQPLYSMQVQNQDDSSAGHALSLLFDTHRAPNAKSMGLLQGNFLDAVDVSGSLQLAVVIDASESMEDQLKSIRKNLHYLISDLDRILDGSIETAVVTYSDIGDKTVPVTIHSQGFVDAKATERIISQLVTASGKPYFPEAADLGVHRAINSLPWSDEVNIERWILVIADAPPYEPSFKDAQTGAKRWYETELLLDLANQKGIKVHCLLCNSRESEKKSFEMLLDDTRKFMTRLSSDTGGLMLDMSYDQVRKALADSAQRMRTQYVRIGHITKSDIQNARGESVANADADQPLRIVVVPLLPLDEVSFFHQRPEVQVATELRDLLKQMPNSPIVHPRQIQMQITRLKSEGVPVEDWPQALCYRLRAPLIITGQLRSARDQLAVSLEVRGPDLKEPLASIKLTADSQNLARQIIGQLVQTRAPSPEISPLINRLTKYATDQQIDGTEIGALSKLKPDERQLLMSGLSALEQATGYAKGDLNGLSLLQASEESLKNFLADNPTHSYALMMLASSQFNLAAAYEATGSVENAKAKFTESTRSIQSAFQSRNQLVDELLKLELEGDYHLLVRKQYPASIERYNTIIGQSEASPLNSSLHAHWMLAGILSGDWGVEQNDPSLVDLAAARGHLIKILAHWPESSQANLIRQNLMWDPRNNKSRTPYLARMGDSFATK